MDDTCNDLKVVLQVLKRRGKPGLSRSRRVTYLPEGMRRRDGGDSYVEVWKVVRGEQG